MYAHKDDPSMKNVDLKEWSAATDFKSLPKKKASGLGRKK
jgi:hypothetical protein